MYLFEYADQVLWILFFVAIIAGFLDTLAGGGGLITVPALILSGMPPLLALGTNKFQGCAGTAVAAYMMFKNRRNQWASIYRHMVFAFIGALLGSTLIQFVDVDALNFVIPMMLFLIGLYFLTSPMIVPVQPVSKISERVYERIILLSIGSYDGMFGPGTGSLFTFSGNALRGLGLVDAIAAAKPLNFCTNAASLLIFAYAGSVDWKVGSCMVAGQAIGSFFGSKMLLRINPLWLRFFVVAICFALLAKYISI